METQNTPKQAQTRGHVLVLRVSISDSQLMVDMLMAGSYGVIDRCHWRDSMKKQEGNRRVSSGSVAVLRIPTLFYHLQWLGFFRGSDRSFQTGHWVITA